MAAIRRTGVCLRRERPRWRLEIDRLFVLLITDPFEPGLCDVGRDRSGLAVVLDPAKVKQGPRAVAGLQAVKAQEGVDLG